MWSEAKQSQRGAVVGVLRVPGLMSMTLNNRQEAALITAIEKLEASKKRQQAARGTDSIPDCVSDQTVAECIERLDGDITALKELL